MTDTEEREIPYAVRRRFEQAGLPWSLLWGAPAVYLAAWSEARRDGKPMTVGEACSAAGITPDALRQRRKAHLDFRAAERWARYGEPYSLTIAEAPQDVVVRPADPLTTNVVWPAPPPTPQPPVDRPLATGPTNTTLATPPVRKKLKPTRRYTPMWVSGSGYEKF